ncbi:MAG: DUF4041 domain-containing protein [Rhodospirillales bacterium]|nr:DUF4041 domain-containing protein [Acetobacter sp.]
MTIFLLILWLITSSALAAFYLLKRRADTAAQTARQQAAAAEQRSQEESILARRDSDAAIIRAWEESRTATASAEKQVVQARVESDAAIARVREESRVAIASAEQEVVQVRQESDAVIVKAWEEARASATSAQQTLEQKLVELDAEAARIQQHYADEALRIHQESAQQLEAMAAEIAPLRGYADLRDAENEVRKVLAEAMAEAVGLRQEAETLLVQSKQAAAQERSVAQQRAKDIRSQADSLLGQATRDAGHIVEEAERRAEEIGGKAYEALRDREVLEQAVDALFNVVNGYGDRYVVPTRSLLDELAADYSHMQAGEELRAAREQSRRLVEMKLAATCKYVEADRHVRANRFVVDAFNGRVDAILSRAKHDNYGTLQQEIQDAFSTVNLNGLAFREARILPEYLNARLAELKWAVVVQELKLKEREEQQRIKEQMREEEKARRDYERALQEAQREEQLIKRALEKAQMEADNATSEQKARFEEQIALLNQRLTDAEAKNQRALSMAQQTRKGNVYIISNVGSFGEGVYKIGLTRRLEPMDRVKELGDASVPFGFDVHAIIASDDAPTLEYMLHREFDDVRVNKVNYRKEFFRLPLDRIKTFLTEKGIEPTFTLLAAAREYRETVALEKMTPEERERYQPQAIVESELLAADLTEESES